MKELEGKCITSIEVDKERQHYIKFNTSSGSLVYEASGECCSESWFADVIAVDALIGANVYSVEEIDIPDGIEVDDERVRDDVTKAYGYKITGSRGVATIAFRNSSNGYYGGSVMWYLILPLMTKKHLC